jgi:PEP-CTERM motif
MNKNDWHHWLRVSAIALPLCLVSLAASAGVIGVGFGTYGTDTWDGSCGASCTQLNLAGDTSLSGLSGYFGPSGIPAFSFSAQLQVAPGAPTGGWQLLDGSGDGLYGSLTASNIAGLGSLSFDITGGTGLFGGVSSGSGGALALFGPNGQFADAGVLFLDASPSQPNVPEPSALALFAAALSALAWGLRRRRPVASAQRSYATL